LGVVLCPLNPRLSCHFTPLSKGDNMMGKLKPPDSVRLLLVEVLRRGKFFKNKEYRKKVMCQLISLP